MRDTGQSALPGDGEAMVAGVRLPAGKFRSPAPSLWATGQFDGAKSAWQALSTGLRGGRLIPLLLSDLKGDPGRPWESGELSPPGRDAVTGLDARTLLPELWAWHVPVPEEDDDFTGEVLDPYSREFPGLAPASDGEAGADRLSAAVDSLAGPLRLGLVVAERPADALVTMGWSGAVNFHDTAAPLTAVLRSWEERFGATLMHVGFDTLDLLVRRPVTSMRATLAVAAEHFAFCSDNVYQGTGSIREYAKELPGATRWSFWWD